MIEGLFAEAKQFHGLRRARYRGLQKVSIQALMSAMAQNIKRIVKLSSEYYWLFRNYLSMRMQALKKLQIFCSQRLSQQFFIFRSTVA
ncbi:MAG: hypothetical protein HKN85_12415 [Gammaproteobacteria bacterium]|nr:hypothetical protein [Gammaproteobacteria bacterium]